MKIQNLNLKNSETSTAWGVLSFDDQGCAEAPEEASALLSVPGFSLCAGCDCDDAHGSSTEDTESTEPAKEMAPAKPSRKKKAAE